MFMLKFTHRRTGQVVEQAQREIAKGSYSMLEILHHLTAGFKAYYADYGYSSIDQCRLACGGAGFLMSSGLAYNVVTHAPHPTHEGVNVIMYQQSARMLLR
jgi:acyl-CoA oxidase